MELKDHDDRVDAFRAGDRDLLQTLYEAYREDVEQMLRHGFTFTSGGETIRFRGCRQPFRLREMLQDSFIHAFRERVREGYDASQAYRPYLLTVVRNHMIDQFRREQLERELFVSAGEIAGEDEHEQDVLERMADGDDDDESPEQETLRRELAELLEEFVDDLDETKAEILERYMLGELTQHEMAEQMDATRNDVRKHIRGIRRQLLGHLKREGFVDDSDLDDVLRNVATLGLIGATR